MKCPCPICNGKGYVYNALGSFNEDCGHCQGTGKVRVEGEPMTNEEWLKSMTTEELAGWIYRAMFYKSCQKDVEDGAYMQMMTKKDYIENWLKEKHDDNMGRNP